MDKRAADARDSKEITREKLVDLLNEDLDANTRRLSHMSFIHRYLKALNT